MICHRPKRHSKAPARARRQSLSEGSPTYGRLAASADRSSIELFSGCGGLALGTSLAGFHHSDVVDWNSDALKTLQLNKHLGVAHVKDWNVIRRDIAEYDFRSNNSNVNFVFGGPPCQPFSLGGKHLGDKDRRNMFPHVFRAIRTLRPKAFMFENVKGLTRRTFFNYFQYILNQLRYPEIVHRELEEWTQHSERLQKMHLSGAAERGLFYRVMPYLVNAADYGVPQKRERVIIVGIRSDFGREFCAPSATHSERALEYAKWVTGEYWESHKVPTKRRPRLDLCTRERIARMQHDSEDMFLKPWRTVRDAIADLPPPYAGKPHPEFANHILNLGAKSYHGHTGSPWDEPSKALKAGDHGVPGGENMLRDDEDNVRYFTVRECARLQTFPDNWRFEGSWSEAMRQLGNAVPVELARIFATQLAGII